MVNTNKRALENLIDLFIYNKMDTFFLVTGGAIAPTVDYIGQHPSAKYYCFQHEQSAAMAAEGYYRTTGKVGVVLSTSGPGAQNLLNGICGCWYESIPAIFITGQVATYESLDSISMVPRQVGFQETPVVESFKYFTKYCEKITRIEDFESTVNAAIQSSISGRFGPVLLDIPVNIQTSVMESFTLQTIIPTVGVSISSSTFSELNSAFEASKRPLLLLGNGIRLSNSVSQVRELIDKLNIPFVVSWGGFDLIEHDHPLFVGDIGVYGDRAANFVIQNCDLLISIGSRLDTRQTGGSVSTFSRNSFKVMVDIDANEIFKNRGVDINLPIVGDAKDFLTGWLNALPSSTDVGEWKTYIQKCINSNINKRETSLEVLSSYEFLQELDTHLPNDAVVVPDEGGNLVWSMGSIKIKNGQRMFSNFGNSSMGYALPSTIGAAIGTSRPVICIDGDGGFQMNLQELQTVKQYNLPVKIFILNNNCYGIIKQFQDTYFGSRYTGTDGLDYTAPNFTNVAMAYGIPAVTASKDNYKDAIQFAMNHDGPILVNVLIDRNQKLTPKLEFGNPLEDMSPYITDDELKEHMLIDTLPRRTATKGEWVTLQK
jgi:acetolactate synthase-1/2/3 large subunit